MAIANASMIRSGGIIQRVSAGAALAIGGIGLLSLRSAGDFEQSMNILGAVSSATDGQMKRLQSTALSLGRDMKLPGVTARDAADAMTELARGGLRANQVIAASRGTLQLATAANIDFGEAAKLTTSALAMFDLDANQASRAANVFAAAANKSRGETVDFAYGLQSFGAQAHDAGVSIEEATGALAMMVQQGFTGEVAGTALKTMFIRLANPTKKAAAAMADMGITTKDAHGNFLPLSKIIPQFEQGLRGMGTAQRAQTLATIFGVRANAAMMSLMGEAAGKTFPQWVRALTGTNDAQRIAEARMKGFNGAVEKVKNAVGTLAVELGMQLLPWATRTANAMAAFVSSLTVSDFQPIIDAFKFLKATIQGVFTFISGNHGWLLPLIAGAYAGVKAFQALRAAMMLYTAVTAAAAAGTLAAMLPIIAIAAAIAALVAGFIYAYTHFEGFRVAVDKAFNGAKQIVQSAMPQIVSAVRTGFERVRSVVGPIMSAVVGFVRTHWNTIKTVTQTIMSAVAATVRTQWNLISGLVRGAMTVFSGVVRGGLNVIKGIVNVVMGAIRGDWSRVWQGLGQIVRGVWQIISGIVRGGIQMIAAVVRSGMSMVRSAVTAAWNAVKAATSAAWNGIKSAVSGAVRAIPGIVASALGGLAGIAAAAGRAMGQGLVSGITSMFGAVAGAAAGLASRAAGAIGSALRIRSPSKVTEAQGKAMGDGLILGWLAGTRDLPEKIKTTLKNALEAGKRQVESSTSMFEGAFSKLAEKALAAFDAQTSQHQTPAEKRIAEINKAVTESRLTENVANARAELEKLTASGGADPAKIADLTEKLNDANAALLSLQNGPSAETMRKLSLDSQDAALKVEELAQKLREAQAKGTEGADPLRVGTAQNRVSNAKLTLTSAQRALAEEQAKGDKASASRVSDLQARVQRAQNSVENAQAALQALNDKASEPTDPLAIRRLEVELDEAKLKAEQAAAALATATTGDPAALAEAQAAVSAIEAEIAAEQAAGRTAIVDAERALQEALREQELYHLGLKAEAERKEYEASRGRQKEHLEGQLGQLETNLKKHPERWRYWMKRVNQVLKNHGVTFKASGTALGKAFAQGLRESISAAARAARGIAEAIERVLKLNSPAKEGPLSELDHWWDDFAPTLLKGLDGGAIGSTLKSAVDQGPAFAGARGAGAATGGGQVVFNFPHYVGDKNELMRVVREEYARVAPTTPGRVFSSAGGQLLP
jgi:TP901 family phage tail tape measure protein